MYTHIWHTKYSFKKTLAALFYTDEGLTIWHDGKFYI